MGQGDHLHFLVIAHAGPFDIVPEHPIKQAHRGEILHAGKTHLFQLLEEYGHQPERIRSADAGKHRDVFYNRQHFSSHLHHNAIGIPIRHQAGQRASPGHAIPAGIVNNDQVCTADFRKFRGDAGTSPAPDDRFPGRIQFMQSSVKFQLEGYPPCLYSFFIKANSTSTAFSEKAVSLMFWSSS